MTQFKKGLKASVKAKFFNQMFAYCLFACLVDWFTGTISRRVKKLFFFANSRVFCLFVCLLACSLFCMFVWIFAPISSLDKIENCHYVWLFFICQRYSNPTQIMVECKKCPVQSRPIRGNYLKWRHYPAEACASAAYVIFLPPLWLA